MSAAICAWVAGLGDHRNSEQRKSRDEGGESDDAPSVGDEVHVNGKITRSKKKCPPAGGTAGDRYGDADVRKVTISDRDADTAPVVPAP